MAQTAHTWGSFPFFGKGSWEWGHSERRNWTPEHWFLGSSVAFGIGICFAGRHREIWLETSFRSECIVF